jgi:methyltransferase-like protein 6
MKVAAQNVIRTLKPGGTLLFRDYGRYDEAQIKLGTSRGKELGENYYRKHDGTTCYYFALEDLERLFGTDLKVLELRYLRQAFRNRAEQQERRRVWVQGRFQKPKI